MAALLVGARVGAGVGLGIGFGFGLGLRFKMAGAQPALVDDGIEAAAPVRRQGAPG